MGRTLSITLEAGLSVWCILLYPLQGGAGETPG